MTNANLYRLFNMNQSQPPFLRKRDAANATGRLQSNRKFASIPDIHSSFIRCIQTVFCLLKYGDDRQVGCLIFSSPAVYHAGNFIS